MQEPLLPLLSGMFGVATLIYSINESQSIPEQKDLSYTEFDGRKTISGTIRGAFAGFITALLPGVSAASASAITAQGSKMGDHGFMVLLGSLGSASFILSLAAFISIEKSRNGAMAVITQLSAITMQTSILFLSCALIATGCAALLTVALSRKAAQWLPKMPYMQVCISVIIFVSVIVWLRSGWLGILVLATSSAVGLLPAALKTARAQAMGCLLLPLLVVLW
jgi:putative membrane protein